MNVQQQMQAVRQLNEAIEKDGLAIMTRIVEGSKITFGVTNILNAGIYSAGNHLKGKKEFVIFCGFAHRTPRNGDAKLIGRMQAAGELLKHMNTNYDQYSELAPGATVQLNDIQYMVLGPNDDLAKNIRAETCWYLLEKADPGKQVEFIAFVPLDDMNKIAGGKSFNISVHNQETKRENGSDLPQS